MLSKARVLWAGELAMWSQGC